MIFEYENQLFASEHSYPITHVLPDLLRQAAAVEDRLPQVVGKVLSEQGVERSGLLPMFASRGDLSLSLYDRMEQEYGFGTLHHGSRFLLAEDGTYLYGQGEDEPLRPLLLLMDIVHKEFVYIYPYAICVFGDNSGSLTMTRMD